MRWRVWAVVTLLISVPAWSATYSVSQMNPQASDEGPGRLSGRGRRWARRLRCSSRATGPLSMPGSIASTSSRGTRGCPARRSCTRLRPAKTSWRPARTFVTGWRRIEGARPIYEVAWHSDFIIDTINGRPIRHHPNDAEHVRSGRAEQMVVDGEVWDYPQIQLSLADMSPVRFSRTRRTGGSACG